MLCQCTTQQTEIAWIVSIQPVGYSLKQQLMLYAQTLTQDLRKMGTGMVMVFM